MSRIVFFGLWMIGYFLMMFYVMDLGVMERNSVDNDDALEIASKTAISQSINRGTLRVYEKLTIDPEVAEATFLRSYANNVGFNNPETKRKIDIYEVSSEPPMIAAEVTTSTVNKTKEYLTIWDEYTDNQNSYSNSRHIVIYEAKSKTKPPQGGISE